MKPESTRTFIISSCGGSFSVFFYACELPSCGLFFSFRLAYLYVFKSYMINRCELSHGIARQWQARLFYLFHEYLCRLESRDLVLGNDERGSL